MGLDREKELQGTTSALIGECPHVPVVIGGVEMTGLLDTGSQTTLMRHIVLMEHFPEYGVKEPPSFIILKAANGIKIPCLGYAIMDFEIEGHKIAERGVFIVWPARRRGVTIPARSEVVVWGRA